MAHLRRSGSGRSSPAAGRGPSARAASARGPRAARRAAVAPAGPPTRITGTGFSVCAVCGPPVSGSIITSQLPWSAVTMIAPPISSTAASTSPRPAVHRLDRLDRRLEDAGVPDHVRVGVVDHDQRVVARADRRDQVLGHLGRRHLRLQVVGPDLRARRHVARLALLRLLDPAVEEEGDVRDTSRSPPRGTASAPCPRPRRRAC